MACEHGAQYRVLIDWDETGDIDAPVPAGVGGTKRSGDVTSQHILPSVGYTITPALNICVWIGNGVGTYTLPAGMTAAGPLLQGSVSTTVAATAPIVSGTSTGDRNAVFSLLRTFAGANIVAYGIEDIPSVAEYHAATDPGTIEFTTGDLTRDHVLVAVQAWDRNPDQEMSTIPQAAGVTWEPVPPFAPTGVPVSQTNAWFGTVDQDGPVTVGFLTGEENNDNHAFLFVLDRPITDFPPVAPNEDVTHDVLARTSLTAQRGRDQARTLAPPKSGESEFELCNVDRDYSPENEGSPFYGQLQPGRDVRVQALFKGELHGIFRGYIDDYTVAVGRGNRAVGISCVDVLSSLENADAISTPVYRGIRSGEAVNILLDAIGWPEDLRDIDRGSSVFPWWWVENEDGLQALINILNSEGPPSVAYVNHDGIFVYRDRHHRLVRQRSLVSQGLFAAARIDCEPHDVLNSNPDFTTSVADWHAFSFATLEWSPDGGGSAKITPPVDGPAIVEFGRPSNTRIPVSPGRIYSAEVTTWMPDSTKPANVMFRWVDSGGSTISDTIGDIVQIGPDPKTLWVTGYAPPGAAEVSPRLWVRDTPTPDEPWFVSRFAMGPPGSVGMHYHEPFEYENGIREIVNSATFSVNERFTTGLLSEVWNIGDRVVPIPPNSTAEVTVEASEPFIDAVTPVAGTDFKLQAGTVEVELSRTSGQSTTITFTAGGGGATIRELKLRAVSVPVLSSTEITVEDPSTFPTVGRREYPNEAPYIGRNDAQGVGEAIMGQYAVRSPSVGLRLVNCDDDHLRQILTREISDRVTIVSGELGMAADFYIERVEHDIRRLGKVHSVVFGTQKVTEIEGNVFTLDVSELDGPDVLGRYGLDDPSSIFILDDPVQGRFGTGQFAR